jgi:hypothetical protein
MSAKKHISPWWVLLAGGLLGLGAYFVDTGSYATRTASGFLALGAIVLILVSLVQGAFRWRNNRANNSSATDGGSRPRYQIGLIIFSISILILAGISFWWYSYRPQAIKRHCYYSVREDVGSFQNLNYLDRLYDECLKSRGI